jgi:hypothetical protein
MNNNQEMKLYQLNFPGMNLPSEEQVLHSTTKVTPTNAIAAFCAECSASPAACTKSDCKLWNHRPCKRKKKKDGRYEIT